MDSELHRRALLTVAVAGGAIGLVGCSKKDSEDGESVSAVEDLMREHGVIRRILVIYAELARRLSAGGARFDPRWLGNAARLFRTFGEDYHERALEEQFIFPQLRSAHASGAALVDTLLLQHQRGRAVTDYIQSVAAKGGVSAADAKPLSNALSTMVRMYNAHTAREDTVVFPSWKKAIGPDRVKEMGDKFEDIEHQRFGGDGFELAVSRVTAIEVSLGLGDLADFTAPEPPNGP